MLLLLVCTTSAAAQSPRQILLLYSQERDFAPHFAFTQLFLPELSRAANEPIDFIEVALQPARASREAPGDSTVDRVRARLGGDQPDLVVAIGGPAATFAQQHRAQLFPAVPVLLASVDAKFVRRDAAGAYDAAISIDHEPKKLIEHVLEVLPQTRHVLVVIGASHHERGWLADLQQRFKKFGNRLTFSWTSDLSFAEIKTRAASLPPHSAILFSTLLLDAGGAPHIEEHAIRALHEVANAPIFGVRSTSLGNGIIGGPLLSMEDLSAQAVKAALQLLSGPVAAPLMPPPIRLSAPVYDWRELRRWGIDESRLPPGSRVEFRETTAWQRFRLPIVGAATVVGIEGILLVALFTSLARRRRAERPLRESEARLRQMLNAAPAMLWHSGADTRVTEVNGPMREFTGLPLDAHLGERWLALVHPDDKVRVLQTYHEAFARRESFRLEVRSRRHDGEFRWLLHTGVPRFVDGMFGGYVGSAIDITDFRSATTALSNLSHRLMQDQEEERARVARTLQDDLCQRMMALTIRLNSWSQPARGDDAVETRQRVQELSGQFGQIAGELFAISDQLHSSNLALLGLVAASRDHCEEISAQHDVRVEFYDEGVPPEIPGEVALALYRVLQEALQNAVKFAKVQRVTVSLRGGHGELHLKIADEGAGFDPNAAPRADSVGLVAMRERLRLVGGECTIESRPGAGTQVRARAPLQKHASVA